MPNSLVVLRYFRLNDPYRLISLLFLLLLAAGPLLVDLAPLTLQELHGMVLGEEVGHKLLYVQLIDRTPPLMAVLEGLMDLVFQRSLLARHLLALLLIFFQAAYFGILLINNRAYNESTYVPPVIFGILCLFSFDLVAITPELVASTLLLFALNNLFREIEFRVENDTLVLKLGVYIGLASLVQFDYSIFLPGSMIILIIFARASFRKILLMFFGFLLIHAGLCTLYFWYGKLNELWIHFYASQFSSAGLGAISSYSLAALALVPVLFFIFSLFMLTREARFTKYQSQLFQVMFIWLLLAAIKIGLDKDVTPHSLFICIPPFAYFISHYLLLIRRKWISESMFWFFLIGVLAISYAGRYQWTDRIRYEGMLPAGSPYESMLSGKKVMVLGRDPGLYRQNRLGGYFLDWRLSEKYFRETDTYENLILIHEAIHRDAPDVIVDEADRMEVLIQRIPDLRMDYSREGKIYRRIKGV